MTPQVSRNGYSASLGAAAVTDTPPWAVPQAAERLQAVVDEVFLEVAVGLGLKLALEAERVWDARCAAVCTDTGAHPSLVV